jgi:hypothetical protein
LRAAYNSAVAGRASESAQYARAAVEAAQESGDERLAGWIGETHASYLHAVDPVAAQDALRKARRANNAVLRPVGGLDYQQITSASPQSQEAVTYLTKRYPSGADLFLGVAAILSDLVWDNERTDEAEAALADLGMHLGFVSQRPELVHGIGSDVLWAMGNHTYAVIEAKTGATASLIWKKDINQLGGSVNWCVTEYGHDATVIPVIVHPTRKIERSGTPPQGTRVITKSKLRALESAVQSCAKSLAHNDQYRIPTFVDKQLQHHKLTPETIFAEFAEAGRREPR